MNQDPIGFGRNGCAGGEGVVKRLEDGTGAVGLFNIGRNRPR